MGSRGARENGTKKSWNLLAGRVWEVWEVWEDGEEVLPPTLPTLKKQVISGLCD
jgi:hypothetical protein